MTNNFVFLEEQGTRDGFQVENKWIPTELKVAMIERSVAAGLKRVQLTAFVNPKLVPQMADAAEVCAGITKQKGVVYSGLVLNTKGVERAAAAGLTHIAASISASDTHSRKNANRALPEAIKEFGEMVAWAKNANLVVRGGIQCAFGCRYEGKINETYVLDLVKQHLDTGIDEISLADSTGMGNPATMQRIMEQVVALAGDKPVILHLHDTEGKGLANLLAALQVGVRHFDTAFGGLGGCPFIKGATGNIATEDTALMLHQMGYQTGIDIAKVVAIAKDMEAFLERKLPGKIKDVPSFL